MVTILPEINLKKYNTFGIEASCTHFTELNTIDDFIELIKSPIYKNNPKLIIGGGSNLLFTKDFKGLVIKNALKGIELIENGENKVKVKAMAGEIWHEFVLYCIKNNFAGLENLSLIPGCVGASPMQNIGAYGVEIKDHFFELEALDMVNGKIKVFKKEDCHFGYRESVFKHELKNKYLIISVTFLLSKKAEVNTSYGAIRSELDLMGIKEPSIKDVSDAVIRIRQSKLPDPAVMGNAGSFFKNPEITNEQFERIKKDYPEIVSYPQANGKIKLAAGWLIEQCGLKGTELKGAAVHSKQALVLVNKDHATGSAVYELSTLVLNKVTEKFGVDLEREVNII